LRKGTRYVYEKGKNRRKGAVLEGSMRVFLKRKWSLRGQTAAEMVGHPVERKFGWLAVREQRRQRRSSTDEAKGRKWWWI